MGASWTMPGGQLTVPGRIRSDLDAPVDLIERGDGIQGQIITTELVNLSLVRMYIAGNSNIAFDPDWYGVMEPLGRIGARVPVVVTIPYRLWLIPQNWDPEGLRELERNELYGAGYNSWREKHEQWAREATWTRPEVFKPKAKKKPTKRRDGHRRLQRE